MVFYAESILLKKFGGGVFPFSSGKVILYTGNGSQKNLAIKRSVQFVLLMNQMNQ